MYNIAKSLYQLKGLLMGSHIINSIHNYNNIVEKIDEIIESVDTDCNSSSNYQFMNKKNNIIKMNLTSKVRGVQ